MEGLAEIKAQVDDEGARLDDGATEIASGEEEN